MSDEPKIIQVAAGKASVVAFGRVPDRLSLFTLHVGSSYVYLDLAEVTRLLGDIEAVINQPK